MNSINYAGCMYKRARFFLEIDNELNKFHQSKRVGNLRLSLFERIRKGEYDRILPLAEDFIDYKNFAKKVVEIETRYKD